MHGPLNVKFTFYLHPTAVWISIIPDAKFSHV